MSNIRRCHQLTRILRICQYISNLRFGATLEDLARLDLGCSEKTLRRDLKALFDVGYVTKRINQMDQAVWTWSPAQRPIHAND